MLWFKVLLADIVTGGMSVKTGWENERGLGFGNIENNVGVVNARILTEGGISKSGSLHTESDNLYSVDFFSRNFVIRFLFLRTLYGLL